MQIRLPYVEPIIRTLAGTLITVSGLTILLSKEYHDIALGVLFFVSLNLAQSGLSGFCMMEKLLKRVGFRSEIDTIRELHEAVSAREAEARHHLETLNMLNEVVIEVSRDFRIIQASEPLRTLLGDMRGGPSPIGQPIDRIIAEEDRDALHGLLGQVMQGKEAIVRSRFRLHPETGEDRWVEGKFAQLKENGVATGIRGILHDVTEPHLQEQRIARMALHDALTGLPNRVLLDDRMQQAAALAQREKSHYAVLFIDLDNFKYVNDVYGHKMGDLLLVEVSKALTSRLRQSDTLARWGGDEFIVLLPNVKGVDDVMLIAGKLAQELQAHLEREHPHYHITLSIGGALYPEDADTAENLLIQADKALFHAKSQGRNNIQMFGSLSRGQHGYKDVDFTTRFSDAVKQGRIQVHYQPLVDAKTRLPVGMEALARWHDEKYGWVSPASFIPLAENLGLIEQLGWQVIEQALSHFAMCDSHFTSRFSLSLNLSNRQLLAADFHTKLIHAVERHGIAPQCIRLEITESVALLGIDRAKEYLGRLVGAGFYLSLDDFGTGYSSLSYLHEIPADELKIDMSFVRRLNTRSGYVMLKTIIDMGRELGMKVVAEGVESLEAADQLEEMGVDLMQGYYFRSPGPREECMGYVASCLPQQ